MIERGLRVAEMVDEEIIVAEGGNKNRVYKLKA